MTDIRVEDSEKKKGQYHKERQKELNNPKNQTEKLEPKNLTEVSVSANIKMTTGKIGVKGEIFDVGVEASYTCEGSASQTIEIKGETNGNGSVNAEASHNQSTDESGWRECSQNCVQRIIIKISIENYHLPFSLITIDKQGWRGTNHLYTLVCLM